MTYRALLYQINHLTPLNSGNIFKAPVVHFNKILLKLPLSILTLIQFIFSNSIFQERCQHLIKRTPYSNPLQTVEIRVYSTQSHHGHQSLCNANSQHPASLPLYPASSSVLPGVHSPNPAKGPLLKFNSHRGTLLHKNLLIPPTRPATPITEYIQTPQMTCLMGPTGHSLLLHCSGGTALHRGPQIHHYTPTYVETSLPTVSILLTPSLYLDLCLNVTATERPLLRPTTILISLACLIEYSVFLLGLGVLFLLSLSLLLFFFSLLILSHHHKNISLTKVCVLTDFQNQTHSKCPINICWINKEDLKK